MGGDLTIFAPSVSVVIPAYNAGRFLLPAVQSILAQTFTDFELIVIDDGSTDGSIATLSVFNDDRLRIERNDLNLGLVATRNKGLHLAKATLMAILDSDDIAKPDRLEKQVKRFRSDPDLALLGTCADIIDDDGTVVSEIDVWLYVHDDIRRELLNGNRFVQSSVMLRVDAARAVGGYPDYPDIAEDYALWLRLAEDYRVANLPERLVQYRVHGAQVSQRKIRHMREAADFVRMQAWQRLAQLGKTNGINPPIIASRWQRLRGQYNSLGSDHFSWAALYRATDRRAACAATVVRGLCVAPLSTQLWGLLVPTKLNVFYWWRRIVQGGKANVTRRITR